MFKFSRTFGHEPAVASVDRVSPRLVQVRAQGSSLTKLRWQPGDKIKVDVGGGVMRSYTPSYVGGGTMELVAVVHGKGPGSDWASRVQPGDSFAFFGPKRSLPMPEETPPWAAFFGDETTLGVAKALTEALPDSTPVFGALEVEASDRNGVEALSLRVPAVTRGSRRGESLLRALSETRLPEGEGIVWLSGEADSVLDLRRALLRRGLRRSQLLTKAYWSAKGSAHRKMLERTALRA